MRFQIVKAVRNLAQSVEFYEKIGFTVNKTETQLENKVRVAMSHDKLPGFDIVLHKPIFDHTTNDSSGYLPCFSIEYRAESDQEFEQLRKLYEVKNRRKKNEWAWRDSRSVNFINDPDNISLRLVNHEMKEEIDWL